MILQVYYFQVCGNEIMSILSLFLWHSLEDEWPSFHKKLDVLRRSLLSVSVQNSGLDIITISVSIAKWEGRTHVT